MPHFYGLSNNSEEALPEDQQQFPDAEIAGIAYYLLAESKGNLDSDKKDNARTVLEGLVKLRQEELKKGRLADREWKELLDASRRLGDLGLMSVPTRANDDQPSPHPAEAIAGALARAVQEAGGLQAKKPEPEDLSDDETQGAGTSGQGTRRSHHAR